MGNTPTNANTVDQNDNTPLMECVQKDNGNKFFKLIELHKKKHPNIAINYNIQQKTGVTLIMLACFYKRYNVIQYLIKEKTIDITIRDKKGRNVFYYCEDGETAQLMLDGYGWRNDVIGENKDRIPDKSFTHLIEKHPMSHLGEDEKLGIIKRIICDGYYATMEDRMVQYFCNRNCAIHKYSVTGVINLMSYLKKKNVTPSSFAYLLELCKKRRDYEKIEYVVLSD